MIGYVGDCVCVGGGGRERESNREHAPQYTCRSQRTTFGSHSFHHVGSKG